MYVCRFDLGDPWQPGCRKTGACFGWDAPFSENRTRNYENSAIHPRPKEPLGGRLARAAIAQHYTKGTPLLPVLASCGSVAGGGGGRPTGLVLVFGGLGSAGLAEPTFSPKWPGASAVELEIDGNWTFIETRGLELSRMGPKSMKLQLPATGAVTGLRCTDFDTPFTRNPCPELTVLTLRFNEPILLLPCSTRRRPSTLAHRWAHSLVFSLRLPSLPCRCVERQPVLRRQQPRRQQPHGRSVCTHGLPFAHDRDPAGAGCAVFGST